MRVKILYQTLEDRNNPKDICKNGPFICNWENAWLGTGYYFWDTFIDNAHWWGTQKRFEKYGYIVCEAKCNFSFENCFDLTEPEHLLIFKETKEFLQTKESNIKVATVINFLRNTSLFKQYQAVRVNGINSIRNSNYIQKIPFENSDKYLDIKPPYQICIFDRKGLDLNNLKIIYPLKYTTTLRISYK